MKKKPQPAQQAYTVESFCAAFDVSRSRVYEEIAAGRLRSFKTGRRRMITADAARAWLDAMQGKAA